MALNWRSSFSRVPKHKRFEYKPLYYDPKKDEIEKERERLKARMRLGIPDDEPIYEKRFDFRNESYFKDDSKSYVAGQLRNIRHESKPWRSHSHRFLQMAILISLLYLTYGTYKGTVHFGLGLLGILVLLVVLIRSHNS